mgnify:FL=1
MGRNNALTLHLLEYLSHRAGCAYLSDLKYINGWQRARLARVLEEIPAGAADLRTWNDALDYLAQAPPEQAAEDARALLITKLSQPMQNRK